MAYFYEIRGPDNAVLKRDGGFATREAAATAGREDVHEMKAIPKPKRPAVDRREAEPSRASRLFRVPCRRRRRGQGFSFMTSPHRLTAPDGLDRQAAAVRHWSFLRFAPLGLLRRSGRSVRERLWIAGPEGAAAGVARLPVTPM
jgi:hypothetical protein